MIARYFAYGSNMDPARMRARAVPFVAACPGALRDHCLVFDKRAGGAGIGHANVRYQRGATVHGVLYRLSHADAIVGLDPFERTPINYGREVFLIEAPSEPDADAKGCVPAWTYIGNPGVLAEGLLPEHEYLAHLLAGAPLLPADYLAMLRAQPCRAAS